MSKASEKALGELHGEVVRVIKAQLTETAEVMTFNELGEEEGTGVLKYTATPALIAVATKFLKDNDITTDIETNSDLGGIREALAKKQKQSRLASPAEAATDVH